MAPQEPTPYGGDIYHILGNLEGKMDALIARTAEYRADLQTAFERISKLENKQAWIMGAAVVVSLVMPMIVGIASRNFDVKIDPVIENQAK